eukprot:INCI15454.1.p1 GENE.INCI15454.1~~INCI15454.1.p1  ORF type:complete len:716 (-),score=114.10 INCI15454.1:354-2501(-)
MLPALLVAAAAVTLTLALTPALSRCCGRKRRGAQESSGPYQAAATATEASTPGYVILTLSATDRQVQVLGALDDPGALSRCPFVHLAVLRDRIRWRPHLRALALSSKDEFLVEDIARVTVASSDPHVLQIFALARPATSSLWKWCPCSQKQRRRQLYHVRLRFSNVANLARVRQELAQLVAARAGQPKPWDEVHVRELSSTTVPASPGAAENPIPVHDRDGRGSHLGSSSASSSRRRRTSSSRAAVETAPTPSTSSAAAAALPPPQDVLILVNPVSGLKKAPEICSRFLSLVHAVAGEDASSSAEETETAADAWGGSEGDLGMGRKVAFHMRDSRTAARLTVMVQQTERVRHAFDIARSLDPARIAAIVCIGGDGLLHEVVNGLMVAQAQSPMAATSTARACDLDRSKIPLLPIPAGTGNGFAMTLGIPPMDAETAALFFLRRRIAPHDLVEVEHLALRPDSQQPGGRDARTKGPETSQGGGHQGAERGGRSLDTTFCISFVSYGIVSDTDRDSDLLRWMGSLRFSVMALWKVLAGSTVCARVSYRLGVERQGQTPGVQPRGAAETSSTARGGSDCGRDAPLTVVADRCFSEVCLMNIPFVSHDIKFAPFASCDDGLVDVGLLPDTVSRLRIFNIFLLAETGRHVTRVNSSEAGNGAAYFKCSEILVEPLDPRTNERLSAESDAASHSYDIDGEFFPGTHPLRLTVRPHQLRVFR